MRHPSANFLRVTLQAILVYACFVPFTQALASGAKVGDVITGAVQGYSTIPILFNFIAYTAGFFLTLLGLGKLRQHVDRPEQVPLSHAIWHLTGAGFLVSLPYAVSMVQHTLKIATDSGSTKSATTVALSTGSVMSLDVMLMNFVQNVRGPMQFLLWSLGIVLGLFFMITAFMRMARGAAQDGPRGSLGSGTLMRIVIGAILFSLAATSDVFTSTLFGGSIVQFTGMNLAGVSGASVTHINQVMSAIFVFVQIIGFMAFFRGFLILRALADGNNGSSSTAAFTHIIGGAVAINISPMLNALQNTFCNGASSCAVINFS